MSSAQLRLNLVEGSVIFSFNPEAAQTLKSEIAKLVQSIKVAATKKPGSKVTPEPSMEYQYTGDIFLECFCNPNIWPSPFAAKVLITVRDDRIRITTEAELTRIVEDLNDYLEQFG